MTGWTAAIKPCHSQLVVSIPIHPLNHGGPRLYSDRAPLRSTASAKMDIEVTISVRSPSTFQVFVKAFPENLNILAADLFRECLEFNEGG